MDVPYLLLIKTTIVLKITNANKDDLRFGNVAGFPLPQKLNFQIF